MNGVLGSSSSIQAVDGPCDPQKYGQVPQSFDELAGAIDRLEREAGGLVESLEFVLSEQVTKSGESIERGYSCSVACSIAGAASRINRVARLIQETRDRLEL